MAIFNYFGKKSVEQKSVPKGVAMSDTGDRGGISKIFMPYFLAKPPFGWPRHQNLGVIRMLSHTPQSAIGIKTIIDIIDGVPWDIVPKEGFDPENETTIDHQREVKALFLNPNESKENFSDFQKRIIRDMIEINSGVIGKEFNLNGQMVSFRAVDGATFLMNPDRYGNFTDRADIIMDKAIQVRSQTTNLGKVDERTMFFPFDQPNEIRGLTISQAKDQAAYFQFPWRGGANPVPFGVREIVWLQDNPTTYNLYGTSVIEYILQVLQTLVYDIEFYKEYFDANNVPKGIINLPGATQTDVDAFADQWNDMQMTLSYTGHLKKAIHQVPIINQEDIKFERIQFTAEELDFIAQTQLFGTLVWGMLGLNPSEAGFTDKSNRATDLSQDKKMMRKAILPRLKKLAEKYNQEIISEFEFDDVEFRFLLPNVDDETSKAKLFDLQIKSGFRTPNEIRQEEGLEPLEGGDELRKPSSGLPFGQNQEGMASGEDRDRLREAQGKGRELVGERADTIKEFEVFGRFFKRKKEDLFKLIERELAKSRMKLTEQKGLNDILGSLNNLFTIGAIKGFIDDITQRSFREGNDKAEVQLDMNIPENTFQIQFLSNTTFDLIGDLTQETKADIRAILQRSIIEGAGLSKVKQEVKKAFDIAENRAETIARTETARAENMGQLNAMKTSGIPLRKFILIVDDSRTSDVSKAMERKYGHQNKSIPLDANFSVTVKGKIFEGQAPPFMPNDRDTVLYVTQEDFESE